MASRSLLWTTAGFARIEFWVELCSFVLEVTINFEERCDDTCYPNSLIGGTQESTDGEPHSSVMEDLQNR